MKLFGVTLLTAYFLARENETFPQGREALKKIVLDWAVYLLCAGSATGTGWISFWMTGDFQPAIILLAAVLPALLFRGKPVCMIAGATTAFCVLKFLDLNQMATTLFCSEAAVLILAFFYTGARSRMARLNPPALLQKNGARFILLFALAVLSVVIYEKIVQVF